MPGQFEVDHSYTLKGSPLFGPLEAKVPKEILV